MSYITDHHERERGTTGASFALKGFFGFAIAGLVLANVVSGYIGLDLNQAWQVVASLIGGLVGIGMARHGRKRVTRAPR